MMTRQEMIALAQGARDDGAGTEGVLQALHQAGCSSWEAVVILRQGLDLSLPTAKALVFRSELWMTEEQRTAQAEIQTLDQRKAALEKLLQQLASPPPEDDEGEEGEED